jgi:hypothetical protein
MAEARHGDRDAQESAVKKSLATLDIKPRGKIEDRVASSVVKISMGENYAG